MKPTNPAGCLTLCALFASPFYYVVYSSASPVWPAGLYALPMADSGCPKSDTFTWRTGYRTAEMEDKNNKNGHSTNFHLKSVVRKPEITRYFCVKNSTKTDNSRGHWPNGKYCIYKKGLTCPPGFLEGYVRWDDNNGNNSSNRNSIAGELPSGDYNQDTLIYFCCMTTGSPFKRVSLPVTEPFYLLAFQSTSCQEVQGAVFSLEYIVFDTENTNNHDATMYPFPHAANSAEPMIYYCYYRECKWNLTNTTGMFSSPYYPDNYHDFQDCQWIITVAEGYVIQLKFDVFELEFNPLSCDRCNCDYVDVWEETVSGRKTAIGRYCMTFAPPPVIQSSSNRMIIAFHSDHAVLAKGFNASYTSFRIKERVFTTAHVSSETVHRSSSWKTKRVTLDQSTHETSKRMTMATPKQTTNTLATNTPDKDFSSLKSFTSTSSTKVNDVQSSKTWTISPEQTSDVAAQVPVDEHEPHDSVIVALKYSILAVGTLVIVALAVLFVACKLWHRQRCSRMKTAYHENLRYLITYSTVSDSIGSSPPSSPIHATGDSEMEEVFLELKESENPLYDRREEQHKRRQAEYMEKSNPLYESSRGTCMYLEANNPLYESCGTSESDRTT